MLEAPLLVCGSGGLDQRRLSETIDLCGLRDFECAWVIGDTLSQNRVLYEQSKSAGHPATDLAQLKRRCSSSVLDGRRHRRGIFSPAHR